MSIEKFIKAIRNRPLMYVEKLEINYIYYLVIGFLGSNLMKGDIYKIDRIFHKHFVGWVIKWVQENVDSNYVKKSFYWHHIFIAITDSEEDAVKLFFELSEKFFEEYQFQIDLEENAYDEDNFSFKTAALT